MIASEFAIDLAEGADDVSPEDAQVFLDALPPHVTDEQARRLFALAVDMAGHSRAAQLRPVCRALAVALAQWRVGG